MLKKFRDNYISMKKDIQTIKTFFSGKNKISDIRNKLKGIKSTLNEAKNQIKNLEEKVEEKNNSEQQKEKRI